MPPSNDNIGSATSISAGSGSISGTTVASTLETGEALALYSTTTPGGIGYGGGYGVWYSWTAPDATERVFWLSDLSDAYSGDLVDSVITVLDGSNFATANVVAQNDDDNLFDPVGGTHNTFSTVRFTPIAGHTYYIGVSGYNSGPSADEVGWDPTLTTVGDFHLHWNDTSVLPDPVDVTAFSCVPSDISFDAHFHFHAGAFDGYYNVWWSTDPTFATGNLSPNIPFTAGDDGDVVYTVSPYADLIPSTTYYWFVRVHYTSGSFFNTAHQSCTTTVATFAPDCTIDHPADLSAFPLVTITGTVDPGGNDTTVTLEYPIDVSGPPYTDFFESAPIFIPGGSGATIVSFTVTLQENTKYRIYLRAENVKGVCDTFFDAICLYTPFGPVFGHCPTDFVEDYEVPDCTTVTDWTLSSGYTIQDGQLQAYVWQADNSAQSNDPIIGYSGAAPKGGEVSARVTEIGGTQLIGIRAIAGTGVTSNLNGYFIRLVSGAVSLIKVNDGVVTVLATGGTVAAGDQIGLRYDRYDGSLSVWQDVGSIGTYTKILGPVTDGDFAPDVYCTGAATIYPDTGPTGTGAYFSGYVSQSAPVFNGNILDSEVADNHALGDSGSSAAIFPPYSCPDHTPKYEWRYVGPPGDTDGQHQWVGPWHGGDGAVPHSDCLVWYLQMRVYVHGRIDCYNAVWSSGAGSIAQGHFNDLGYTELYSSAVYPDDVDYAALLATTDSDMGSGFYVFDSNAQAKAYKLMKDSIPMVQAAYASQGAVTYTNVVGGKKSYSVVMPVKFAPGKIDNFKVYYEKCLVARKRRTMLRYL